MPGQFYDGATWRTAATIKAYDGGTWRTCATAKAYDGGTWREFFSSSCSGSYALTGAGCSWGTLRNCSADCPPNQQITATWTPDSACSGQHIEVALSQNGGGYTTICDDGANCDACTDTPYTNYTIPPFVAAYTSSSTCNSNCDVSCYSMYFNARIELHDEGTHTICDTETSGSSGTRYTCECFDCSGGGPS
jgi:hypothetical protein